MSAPRAGDKVILTYAGEVEIANEGSIRVDGLWHYPGSRACTSITVTERAIEVGWHEVTIRGATADGVFARYWSGTEWRSSTSPGRGTAANKNYYVSVQFIGGAS